MLSPTLVMKRTEDKVTLCFPLWYRLIFAASALLLLMLTLYDTFLASGSFAPAFPSPVALILLVVSVMSGLYEERWIMDTSRQTMEARMGLLIAFKKHTYRYNDITAFNLRFVMRGSLSSSPEQQKKIHTKPFIRLEAHLSDGEVLVIEIDKAIRKDRLALQGEALARETNKPFHREL